jgi:hypothetical protein
MNNRATVKSSPKPDVQALLRFGEWWIKYQAAQKSQEKQQGSKRSA